MIIAPLAAHTPHCVVWLDSEYNDHQSKLAPTCQWKAWSGNLELRCQPDTSQSYHPPVNEWPDLVIFELRCWPDASVMADRWVAGQLRHCLSTEVHKTFCDVGVDCRSLPTLNIFCRGPDNHIVVNWSRKMRKWLTVKRPSHRDEFSLSTCNKIINLPRHEWHAPAINLWNGMNIFDTIFKIRCQHSR